MHAVNLDFAKLPRLFSAVAAGLSLAVAAAVWAAEPKLSDADLKKIEAALPAKVLVQPAQPRKVLLFCRTEGFNHVGGILACNTSFTLMGKKTGAYSTEISTDMAAFEPAALARFDAVVFDNTTALKFENPKYRKALLDFVEGGKGIVGIHSATDNFYQWPEGAARWAPCSTAIPGAIAP